MSLLTPSPNSNYYPFTHLLLCVLQRVTAWLEKQGTPWTSQQFITRLTLRDKIDICKGWA